MGRFLYKSVVNKAFQGIPKCSFKGLDSASHAENTGSSPVGDANFPEIQALSRG